MNRNPRQRDEDGRKDEEPLSPKTHRRAPRAAARLLAAFAGLTLAACGTGGDAAPGEEDGGVATVAIALVPDDVACIDVSAVGGRTVQRRFGVLAGQAVTLRLDGLPTGDVTFYGMAFSTPCAAIPAGGSPSWVGDPVRVTLLRGAPQALIIVLRPNGRAIVSVEFEPDVATGGPCVGPTPGCVDPADTSPSSAPPPAGAIMVGPGQFLAGLNDGNLVLTSERLESDAEVTRLRRDEANRAQLRTLLAGRTDVLESVLEEPVEDATLARLPDGNFRLALAAGAQVVTMGSSFAVAEALDGITRFPTQENQLAVYTGLYSNLPADYLARHPELPRPQDVAAAPADALSGWNRAIAADLDAIVRLLPPALGPSHACSSELGAPPNPGDGSSSACTPSPFGLYRLADFSLKPHVTCARDQGNRGTCVAFAITAATEARVSVRHGQWTNLSEEKLYFSASRFRDYGDGLDPSWTVSAAIASSFRFPWEFQWDYNPSRSREDRQAVAGSSGGIAFTRGYYMYSCDGYTGEHCSDTSHQGDLVCADLWPARICAWDGSAPAGSGYGPTMSAAFLSLALPDPFLFAHVALALKMPLVLSIKVTPSFVQARTGGMVAFMAGERSRGNHAVALVGSVPNALLPAGFAPGAGGGYFIVKNSWGSCWGDGGHAYLPFDYVRTYGLGITGVAEVN